MSSHARFAEEVRPAVAGGCGPHRCEMGRPIAQIARDLGVQPRTLGNGVARDRAEHAGTQGLSTGDVAELKRICAENAQLRMERDVLKRSVVVWVKEATTSAWPTSSPTRGPCTGAVHRDLRDPRHQHLLVLQVDRPRARRATMPPGRRGGRGGLPRSATPSTSKRTCRLAAMILCVSHGAALAGSDREVVDDERGDSRQREPRLLLMAQNFVAFDTLAQGRRLSTHLGGCTE
jgi:transposase